MLYKAKTLESYKLHGLDGEIGKVKDLYFDDRDWTIRYVVADTGEWLISRQVLISPHSLAGVDRDQGSITVKLTKDQIEHSPTLNRDKPVSRQFERAYFGFYGFMLNRPGFDGGSTSWRKMESCQTTPAATSPRIAIQPN